MERKHETDDVCDLGVTRNLVSGDAAGSRLPRSTATKYSLCPQTITVGNGIFVALDVCDTTNIIKISWGVCSANCLHCCAALTPGKTSQTHQSRFFMMWLCPWRALLPPQLSGRLCWFLLLIKVEFGGLFSTFLLLSARCRVPLCWGLVCDAILGGIFQICFIPLDAGRTSEM